MIEMMIEIFFSVKDGVFRQYRGARDKDSFISFIEDKKWSQVEEISSWKDPNSMQMTLVSYFFKLSMVLRNVHTILTEEYQVSHLHPHNHLPDLLSFSFHTGYHTLHLLWPPSSSEVFLV